MSAHLSELCKTCDIDRIADRLRELCPERLSMEEEEENEERPIPAGFTREAHEQMRLTFSGLWGYQDDDGRTPLHWAVAMLNFSLAQTLLARGCNALADTTDHDGTSPFATACVVGASETFLDDLLAHATAQRAWRTGGDAETLRLDIVNGPDNHGNTPLLHAAGRGLLSTVRYLLRIGADIDQRNKRGQTALHRAAARGTMELVEELISVSARLHDGPGHRRWVNHQDNRGDTALFYASADENEELGRFLLRNGADRNLRNKEGKEFWEV